MPSFNVVSEVDLQEVVNAVDQAKRELDKRFDFKNTGATFEQESSKITMRAPSDYQLGQMLDILRGRLAARKVDVRCLDLDTPQVNVGEAWQVVNVKQGLESEVAKKIVKLIKVEKLKVQAAIEGDKVRVTGKKRDDLQQTIALLKESKLDVPLQYENFRD